MNKNVLVYEAPEVKVVEVLSEGVLCSSFQKYEDGGDIPW